MAESPKYQVTIQLDVDPSKIDEDPPASMQELRQSADDFAAEIMSDPAFSNVSIKIEELPQ